MFQDVNRSKYILIQQCNLIVSNNKSTHSTIGITLAPVDFTNNVEWAVDENSIGSDYISVIIKFFSIIHVVGMIAK